MSDKIIGQTKFSKGKEGLEKSFRLILKQEDGMFVSRYQVQDNGMEHSGDYSRGTLNEAKEAFVKRVAQHNELFPEGNISHLGNEIEWL